MLHFFHEKNASLSSALVRHDNLVSGERPSFDPKATKFPAEDPGKASDDFF